MTAVYRMDFVLVHLEFIVSGVVKVSQLLTAIEQNLAFDLSTSAKLVLALN